LSNFSPAPVDYDDTTYPTVEHAYQAAKTLDMAQREKILNAKTPAMAKRYGKKVTLREDWDQIKMQVMRDLLDQKFACMTAEAEMLKETGTTPLVEGNWWGDEFWGVCKGVGENHLGKILMEIRDYLNEP